MLCAAMLVLALAGNCPADGGPSHLEEGARGAQGSRGAEGAHAAAAALRRQLMRDNYDYLDDEPPHNRTVDQKSSELAPANSKASSSESHQHAQARGHRAQGEGEGEQTGEHEHLSRRALHHDQRRHAERDHRQRTKHKGHSPAPEHGGRPNQRGYNDPYVHRSGSGEDNDKKEPEQPETRQADQQAGDDVSEEQHSDTVDKRRHRDVAAAPRPATTTPPAQPRIHHSHRNVTYKLLTLKSRDGRRRGVRRLVEERGPGGVAIISVDAAPPRPLRLPRARRQYMRA